MTACLLLVALLGAGPTDAAAADRDAEVRRLISQLDAAELGDRDAAEAELLRRGPAILDRLPTPDGRMSAETRQRLARVRWKLEQAAAEAAARGSTITLRADAMSLATILAEFQRQSGNTIVDDRAKFGQATDNPKPRVDFDGTPFWPALDRLLDRAGLTLYPFSDRPTLNVVASADDERLPRSGRASYAGPFRIDATTISARRDLRRRGAGAMSVAVEIAWEPRVRVLGLSQRMADVRAVDERGERLPVLDPAARLEIPAIGRSPVARFEIPFRLPPRGAREIASLKDAFSATIAGKPETFRFTDLADARNVERRIASVTVALEQAIRVGDGWEVRILVRFDNAGDALASHHSAWIFDNPAHLVGRDGKPIAYASYETTRQGKNEAGVAYFFKTNEPIDNLAFVYETPGVILDRTFDFELKNLKLP